MKPNPPTTDPTMAERVAAMDWSSTPLGPIDRWPQALRVAVGICLHSRFPMFVWWGAQLINIYNDAYVPILGKRNPAALGRPARETWHEIWPVVGPQAEVVMTRGEATWNERVLLVMERHGFVEETWFTWSYSPIPDGAGGIGGLFCACTEDTPRVIAERERDRLAAQRQLALDAAGMGWWHYDPQTRVSTWDARYAAIFGVAGTSGPNDGILRRIHPDDLPALWARVEAALDPRDPKPYSAEFRVVRDDGAVRRIEAHGVAHFQGEGDARRATSLVGTVADVTERRRAEELPWTILASITDGFYALDRRWRFTYVNAAAERVLLRSREELVGKDIWVEFPAALGTRFEREYRSAMADGVARQFVEYYPPPLDGWYDVRAYPSAEGLSVYFTDITERRNAEREREQLLAAERAARAEAERASEAKSQFLATLSHELRTPLMPVLLTVSIMERSPSLPPDLREDVATIRRNVELESRLISDLLDLTRISKGKLQLDAADVDLHVVLRAAVDIFRGGDATPKLLLDLRATRHTVRGDPTRLQQVFWNLVNNAIKFTPPDGTVTVRSIDVDGGAHRIRVEVTDTGIGIDPAVLPRLFNAFEQGDARSSRQQAGLGLGLAISRKLAEAHGGTIEAHSGGHGRGSTFVVELPVVGGPASAAAPPRPAEAPVPNRPLRVLLVEDNAPTRSVMLRLLAEVGHRVTGTASVGEALSAAADGEFDLLISDLGLPDGSGLQVMRALRDRFAGRAIALTGYGMDSDVAASGEAGFVEHLTKPVDLATLEAAMRRVASLPSHRS